LTIATTKGTISPSPASHTLWTKTSRSFQNLQTCRFGPRENERTDIPAGASRIVHSEYANLAGLNEVSAGKLSVAQIQESETVSVQPANTTLTPWQVLARPAIPNPHVSWAE
jgi:hypothetical protein